MFKYTLASRLLALLQVLCLSSLVFARKYDDRFVLKQPLSNSKLRIFHSCFLIICINIYRHLQALENIWQRRIPEEESDSVARALKLTRPSLCQKRK